MKTSLFKTSAVKTFVFSSLSLTLMIACNKEADDNKVNARMSPVHCDSTKRMCDQKLKEKVYAQLGEDKNKEALKKEIDLVTDKQLAKLNKNEADSVRMMSLDVVDGNATLKIFEKSSGSSLREILLKGTLAKDKTATLKLEDDDSIEATLDCQKEDDCNHAIIRLHKEGVVQKFEGETKTVNKKKSVVTGQNDETKVIANVNATIRTREAALSVKEVDLKDKSDSFKKLYELIHTVSANAAGQNSIKKVLTQSSEIINGKVAISIAILSNENELLEVQGLLESVEHMSAELKGQLNADLAKKSSDVLLRKLEKDLAQGEDVKKSIEKSIKAVSATKIEPIEGTDSYVLTLQITLETKEVLFAQLTVK